MEPNKNIYLFSVDLEDIRLLMPDGQRYAERMELMTRRYLDFLDRHQCKATFFVVGDVARNHPALIRTIADKGHEIGLHSTSHTPLDTHDAVSFKADLAENIKILKDAGIENTYGFRAPIYSMTAATTWAYRVMADLGLIYSSSVLPAKNPLYGWPGFGNIVKTMEAGILEFPISLFRSALISVPYAGGIYMRILPFAVIKRMLKSDWKKGLPVVGYIHPYDIDDEQERFMHPGINNSKFYNRLMFINRSTLLDKFDRMVEAGANIMPHIHYINNILQTTNN